MPLPDWAVVDTLIVPVSDRARYFFHRSVTHACVRKIDSDVIFLTVYYSEGHGGRNLWFMYEGTDWSADDWQIKPIIRTTAWERVVADDLAPEQAGPDRGPLSGDFAVDGAVLGTGSIHREPCPLTGAAFTIAAPNVRAPEVIVADVIDMSHTHDHKVRHVGKVSSGIDVEPAMGIGDEHAAKAESAIEDALQAIRDALKHVERRHLHGYQDSLEYIRIALPYVEAAQYDLIQAIRHTADET